MIHLKSFFWTIVIVSTLALALIKSEARHTLVQTQEADRVLELQRYPDEPVQLVNLKIGTQSVKDRIKPKFKDKTGKWGVDSVKFKEKDDWYKRVSITMRNVSDKPVYGLQAFLFFKPAGFPMMFSLELTFSKELGKTPLLPGAEVELVVNQGLLNDTLADMKNRGAVAGAAEVSFSLDTVIFNDDLRWYRGKLLRRDSTTPGKWVPGDAPLALKRNQSSGKSAFNHAAPAQPAAPFSTCTAWNGSYEGLPCPDDVSIDCIQRIDMDDNINPGVWSHGPVSARCINDAGSGGDHCTKFTTHTRLDIDSECQACPDADGDGFASNACGGSDCDDSNTQINPNAEESCWDGVDNNCSGAADNQDPCECPSFEGDEFIAGQWFCTLCEDGIDNDCDGDVDNLDSSCNPNQCASPVLVDVLGNGFALTNAAGGVDFDLNSDGTRDKLSWTVAQTDDAWLALDRNGDGVINNGTELFGNFTPQSNPPAGYGRNGFNALAEYDLATRGGNSDRLISERDAVFGSLLLWQDKNHNGVSETSELFSLKHFGLTAIECDYKESKRRDEYGNAFRYRAKVRDTRNAQIGRWAWDVFLVPGEDALARYVIDNINESKTGSLFGWLRL